MSLDVSLWLMEKDYGVSFPWLGAVILGAATVTAYINSHSFLITGF